MGNYTSLSAASHIGLRGGGSPTRGPAGPWSTGSAPPSRTHPFPTGAWQTPLYTPEMCLPEASPTCSGASKDHRGQSSLSGPREPHQGQCASTLPVLMGQKCCGEAPVQEPQTHSRGLKPHVWRPVSIRATTADGAGLSAQRSRAGLARHPPAGQTRETTPRGRAFASRDSVLTRSCPVARFHFPGIA